MNLLIWAMLGGALGNAVNAPVETIEVAQDEAGLRLDRWFRLHFPEVGYSHLQKLLRSGQVRVDSKRVTANARLEPGQQVRVPAVHRHGRAVEHERRGRCAIGSVGRGVVELRHA